MLIFSILLWHSNLSWALGILSLGLFSLLVLFLFIVRRYRTGGVSQAKITGVEKRDENFVSYIASYLVPFATFPLATFEQALAVGVFIGILMVLYVNSNMIYINPTLNFCGWHLYEITVATDQMSHYLIARRDIKPERVLYFVELSTHFSMEKKVKKTI